MTFSYVKISGIAQNDEADRDHRQASDRFSSCREPSQAECQPSLYRASRAKPLIDRFHPCRLATAHIAAVDTPLNFPRAGD
jgi:hypothetical protein